MTSKPLVVLGRSDPSELDWMRQAHKFFRLEEMNAHVGIQDKCPPELKI